MPISSSAIITKVIEDNRVLHKVHHPGCSEFISHSAEILEAISLAIFVHQSVGDYNIIKNGNDGDNAKFLESIRTDWIDFTLAIMEPINVRAGKTIFSPVYQSDIEEIKKYKNFDNCGCQLIFGRKFSFGSNNLEIPSSEDKAIGIKVDANAIRMMNGLSHYSNIDESNPRASKRNGDKPASTKKIQIAHTILRLAWSSGCTIALIALYLTRRKINASPLSILWMAYVIRSLVSRNTSDYGDVFSTQGDSEFIQDEEFLDNFMDKSLNGVMSHFSTRRDDELIQMIDMKRKSGSHILVSSLGFNSSSNASISTIIRHLNKKTNEEINAAINAVIDASRVNLESVRFEFVKSPFSTAVNNVEYVGYRVPDSKLERLIFMDEASSWLSVLESSKNIKIIK